MSSSFIGEKEVSFQDVDAEANKVVVTYADGSKDVFPYEGFSERLSSTPAEKVDLTKERDDRVLPAVKGMLEVCLLNNLKLNDLDYALARFAGSIEDHLKKASEQQWGKPLEDRTLQDLDNILKEYGKVHKQGSA